MINIVVVSHGNLSEQLIKSAEMIAGPAEEVYAVTLQPGDKPETFSQKLDDTMAKIGDQEILILIDILCGTPYNITARQVLKEKVECITGANLPMLIEAMLSRENTSVSELAVTITGVGADSVKNLKPFLKRD
jgi:PTS system mannose-specific IIA component